LKKLLILFCIGVIFAALTTVSTETVYAAAPAYALIADDGVLLYTIDADYEYQPLFALPKTYYVEYTGRSNSRYHIVRYMDLRSGLNGADLFVLKGALNVAETASVDSPYPSVTVRSAFGGAKLYSSPDESSAAVTALQASGTALTYYGSAADGIWHYVSVSGGNGGIYGYIKNDALTAAPDIPPHPNSAASAPDGTLNLTGGGFSFTTAVLTVGIILPAIVIFLLMFKPGKRRAVAGKHAYRNADCAPPVPPRFLDVGNYYGGGNGGSNSNYDGESGRYGYYKSGYGNGRSGGNDRGESGYGEKFPYDKY
jgi:hypothetical protein